MLGFHSPVVAHPRQSCKPTLGRDLRSHNDRQPLVIREIGSALVYLYGGS